MSVNRTRVVERTFHLENLIAYGTLHQVRVSSSNFFLFLFIYFFITLMFIRSYTSHINNITAQLGSTYK